MMDVICIPTLKRYDLLCRLCKVLIQSEDAIDPSNIIIMDNGGSLLESYYWRNLSSCFTQKKPEVIVPPENLGVAGSWNFFIQNFGQCVIANDDVVFSRQSLQCFSWAAMAYPHTVIFENNDLVNGFSTFFVNRPEAWLEMGGFDELLNPAYFEDNDCRRRLVLAGNPVRAVPLIGWRHDNSSTLLASDESYKRMHWCLYKRNGAYYYLKWGGSPGHETYTQPFGSDAVQVR